MMVFDRQECGLGRQVDEGDGRVEKYRGWAKLGVDEMVRRGCGRDRRFGSAWWCWWWREEEEEEDGWGCGWGWGWDEMGRVRSPQVDWRSSRPESSRGCAWVCGYVCVHEGGGSRAASAESTIENRNRSRCRRLGLSCLSLPLQAGAELSPARVPVCEPADGWGPARLPASFY